MNIDTTKSVREMALNIPGATRVFEKLGIDYAVAAIRRWKKPATRRISRSNR
jgi:hypothetical protein